MKSDGLRFNCGFLGCLERVAAAPAVLSQASEAARAGESSLLLERLADQPSLSIEDPARAASEGDEVANRTLLDAGGHLAVMLSGLVNVLNPPRILVGGAFTRFGPLLLVSIRQGVDGRSLPLMSRRLEIEDIRDDEAELHGALVLGVLDWLEDTVR